MFQRCAVGLVCFASLACGQAPPPKPAAPPPSDARVRQLADAYLAAFFDRFPETVTQFGIPGRRQDKLTDNSLDALRAWQQREDGWLAEAKQIDPATIADPSLRATEAIVREALEGSIATRVCRNELWTVSQFVNAWQVQEGYIVTIQPVGTDEARQDALARFGALPHYVETEIANLREGIKQGYTAPKNIVRIVIDQMKTLTSGPLADSPFDSPAVRDKNPAFVKEYDALVKDRINPAFVSTASFSSGNICRRRARRLRCRRIRTARPATTRRFATTARCR